MSLIVVFDTTPQLRLVNGAPGRTFSEKGRVFTDVFDCEMTGFYDWLRDSAGRCMGVLYYPNDPQDVRFEQFFSFLREFDYIRTADANIFEIQLVKCDTNVSLSSGCEQEFVESRIYVSGDNRFAMSFDESALSPEDIQELVGPRT
jgi:hypothetical protein